LGLLRGHLQQQRLSAVRQARRVNWGDGHEWQYQRHHQSEVECRDPAKRLNPVCQFPVHVNLLGFHDDAPREEVLSHLALRQPGRPGH